MHGRHRTCGLLLLALAMSGQALGASTDRAGGEGSGTRIGVLGAVAHPGAYEFAGNEVDLEAALRAAGGVRKDADETVRVIRDGQVRFTVARSQQKALSLRSNDFIVVERLQPSTAGRSNAYLPRELRPGGQSSQKGSSDVIHVGLANVIGRPVVSEVPRDHATILGIVRLLDQPEQILDGMRQIYPLNTYENTPSAGGLPADTVLIFDRSLIQASQLPNFPPPHRVPLPAGSGPLILAVSQNEAPVELDVDMPAREFADIGEGFDASAEAPADEVSIVEVTAIDESVAPALSKQPGIESAASDQAFIDWRLAVLAVGAIALLAGSLRIRSSTRPRQRPVGRLEPVMLPIIEAPEKPRLLDALIEDRLPVFEEPCRLPAPLEFFGRPAATAAARTDAHRTIEAVELAPPHFARAVSPQLVRGRGDAEPPELARVAEIDAAGRRADASHPFESAHRPHSVPQTDGKPSVLDRILTRLDKEARA